MVGVAPFGDQSGLGDHHRGFAASGPRHYEVPVVVPADPLSLFRGQRRFLDAVQQLPPFIQLAGEEPLVAVVLQSLRVGCSERLQGCEPPRQLVLPDFRGPFRW